VALRKDKITQTDYVKNLKCVILFNLLKGIAELVALGQGPQSKRAMEWCTIPTCTRTTGVQNKPVQYGRN